jgi:hypothetical protein
MERYLWAGRDLRVNRRHTQIYAGTIEKKFFDTGFALRNTRIPRFYLE